MQLVGFAAGGVALAFVTPTRALLLGAVAHALSVLILLVGTRRRPAFARAGGTAGPLAGLRALLAVPGMRPILALTWLPAFFAVAPEALAAPYAQVIGGGTVTIGLLLTGLPVGSVLSELIVGSRLSPARRVRLVLPLAAAGFGPVLLFGLTPGLPAAFGLLVLAGAGAYLIGLDQLTLATLPPAERRRGFALVGAGMMVTQGLGFAAAGALAEWLPVAAVVPLCGSAGLATVLAAGRALVRAHPSAAPSPVLGVPVRDPPQRAAD